MIVATYPTKKALREAIGKPLRYQETSIFGNEFKPDGRQLVVGPGACDRKWWATVTCRGGIIHTVK